MAGKCASEKLPKLMEHLKIGHVADATGIRSEALSAILRDGLYPMDETKKRLTVYFGVNLRDLGFEEVPEEKRIASETKQVNTITEAAKKLYATVPVNKGPMYIMPELMSTRMYNIIMDIKHGMALKEANEKYEIDYQLYMVFWKMIHGGMSKGLGKQYDTIKPKGVQKQIPKAGEKQVIELFLKGFDEVQISIRTHLQKRQVKKYLKRYKAAIGLREGEEAKEETAAE